MHYSRESSKRTEATKDVKQGKDCNRQQVALQIDDGTTSSGYGYGLGRPVEPTTGFASLQLSQTTYLDSLQQYTRKTGMFPRQGYLYDGRPYKSLASYPPALDRIAQLEKQPEGHGSETENATDRSVEQERFIISIKYLSYCIRVITRCQAEYNPKEFEEVKNEHEVNCQLVLYHDFSTLTTKMREWEQQPKGTPKHKYAQKFFKHAHT